MDFQILCFLYPFEYRWCWTVRLDTFSGVTLLKALVYSDRARLWFLCKRQSSWWSPLWSAVCFLFADDLYLRKREQFILNITASCDWLYPPMDSMLQHFLSILFATPFPYTPCFSRCFYMGNDHWLCQQIGNRL